METYVPGHGVPAEVGDQIVVGGPTVGAWFFPGPDARVRHLHAGSNMSPRMQQ
ncbi:hypothetical protein ABT083_32445 [Streptomyces goshikiensis]|uniref:hypothetical protein n=1 Tax=Streptomyces goshikiensis TaxID=1942 RepID=UPI00332FADB2